MHMIETYSSLESNMLNNFSITNSCFSSVYMGVQNLYALFTLVQQNNKLEKLKPVTCASFNFDYNHRYPFYFILVYPFQRNTVSREQQFAQFTQHYFVQQYMQNTQTNDLNLQWTIDMCTLVTSIF